MKNYREELNRFRQTNFELLDLEISNELEYCLDNAEENARLKSSDTERFNEACETIKYLYLKCDCDISLSSVVNAFLKAMSDNNNNINKINLKTILEKLY